MHKQHKNETLRAHLQQSPGINDAIFIYLYIPTMLQLLLALHKEGTSVMRQILIDSVMTWEYTSQVKKEKKEHAFSAFTHEERTASKHMFKKNMV